MICRSRRERCVRAFRVFMAPTSGSPDYGAKSLAGAKNLASPEFLRAGHGKVLMNPYDGEPARSSLAAIGRTRGRKLLIFKNIGGGKKIPASSRRRGGGGGGTGAVPSLLAPLPRAPRGAA